MVYPETICGAPEYGKIATKVGEENSSRRAKQTTHKRYHGMFLAPNVALMFVRGGLTSSDLCDSMYVILNVGYDSESDSQVRLGRRRSPLSGTSRPCFTLLSKSIYRGGTSLTLQDPPPRLDRLASRSAGWGRVEHTANKARMRRKKILELLSSEY